LESRSSPGGRPPYDVLLWVESHRAVAIGDTLIDRGHGIELLESWLAEGMTREQVVEGLRPLLALPVELVLPTHGAPTDRLALERAHRLTPDRHRERAAANARGLVPRLCERAGMFPG